MKKLLQLVMVSLICASCGHSGSNVDYDLIPVKTGERYGYINPKGEYIINPQFKNADAFRDGRARVQDMKGNYGFIDKQGNYVIQPEYKEATGFYEGTAWVVKPQGYPMAIKTDGECFLEAKDVHAIRLFSEGLALFSKRCEDGIRKYGFMDKKGNVVIEPAFAWAGSFKNGLAAVRDENGKWGYIDKKGKVVIGYQFDEANNFENNGQAIVKLSNQYGTIDKKGNFVINPQFASMSLCKNGMYKIRFDGGDYGFCDEKGKIVINPQFEYCTSFLDAGIVGVRINDKWGYVNEKGKMIINPQFDKASSFFEKCAFVGIGEKYGIIDTEGKYVVSPQYEDISLDFFYADLPCWDFVDSHYLDIDRISQEIQKLLAGHKLDGMSFPPTVNAALQKYALGEKEVPMYRPWEIKKWYLGEDVEGTLSIEGFFFNEVSDGWWGTKSILNKQAQADKVELDIEVDGNVSGTAQILFEELQKRFKGECGGFRVGITEKGSNHVLITISE